MVMCSNDFAIAKFEFFALFVSHLANAQMWHRMSCGACAACSLGRLAGGVRRAVSTAHGHVERAGSVGAKPSARRRAHEPIQEIPVMRPRNHLE